MSIKQNTVCQWHLHAAARNFEGGDSEKDAHEDLIYIKLLDVDWHQVTNGTTKTQSVRAFQIDSGWVEILLPPIFRQTLASHTALWTEKTTQSFLFAPEVQIEIPKSHLTKKNILLRTVQIGKGASPYPKGCH